MAKVMYLLTTVENPMRVLDWIWRGKESHALLCGQFHFTRSTIGVDMTIEAIATWHQKHKAESTTRPRLFSPSGQKLRSDLMNQLQAEEYKWRRIVIAAVD